MDRLEDCLDVLNKGDIVYAKEILSGWIKAGRMLTLPSAPDNSDDVSLSEEHRGLLVGVLAKVPELFLAPDDAELLRIYVSIREAARWTVLPRTVQRALVGLHATRLRRLQDDQKLVHPRLEDAFSTLTNYSKQAQPGFVVGLGRQHTPTRGSWAEDAKRWRAWLVNATQPAQVSS